MSSNTKQAAKAKESPSPVRQVAGPFIKAPNPHQRSDRNIERALALPAVVQTGFQQPEQLRGYPDGPGGRVAVDQAPFAVWLIVRKQLVETPDFIERSVDGRLHFDPIGPVEGDRPGRTHGVGALFQTEQVLSGGRGGRKKQKQTQSRR